MSDDKDKSKTEDRDTRLSVEDARKIFEGIVLGNNRANEKATTTGTSWITIIIIIVVIVIIIIGIGIWWYFRGSGGADPNANALQAPPGGPPLLLQPPGQIQPQVPMAQPQLSVAQPQPQLQQTSVIQGQSSAKQTVLVPVTQGQPQQQQVRIVSPTQRYSGPMVQSQPQMVSPGGRPIVYVQTQPSRSGGLQMRPVMQVQST